MICGEKDLKLMLTLRIPPFYNVPIRILFLCQYVQSWRNVVPTFTNVLLVLYLSNKCINLSEQYMRRFQFKIACCFMKNLSKWSLLGKIPMDTTVLRYFHSDSYKLLIHLSVFVLAKDWYFCKITGIPIQMTKDIGTW